jgi:hypothetical protein
MRLRRTASRSIVALDDATRIRLHFCDVIHRSLAGEISYHSFSSSEGDPETHLCSVLKLRRFYIK